MESVPGPKINQKKQYYLRLHASTIIMLNTDKIFHYAFKASLWQKDKYYNPYVIIFNKLNFSDEWSVIPCLKFPVTFYFWLQYLCSGAVMTNYNTLTKHLQSYYEPFKVIMNHTKMNKKASVY